MSLAQSGATYYKPPPRAAPASRVGAATRVIPERRIALVIGNDAYRHLPRLENPASDARLMAATLRSVGFQIIDGDAQVNLDRAAFEQAVRKFGRALQGGGVGLFYYAGHGLQWRGSNYLVPVGANPESMADVDFELINAQVVLDEMETAGSKLNVVILDACRNNPFPSRGLRATSGGLAQMQVPRGTLISYATQPGNIALDGSSGHSPYTRALADVIRRPGLPILDVFNQVGVEVDQATGGQQEPWVAHSPLEGTFYFIGPTTINITPPVPAAPTPDAEIVFWQSIEHSKDAADFRDYLHRYPRGKFAGLARNRLVALRPPPAAGPLAPRVQPLPPSGPAPQTSAFTAGLAERIIAAAKAAGMGVPRISDFSFREPPPDLPAGAAAYLGAWGPGLGTYGSRDIKVIESISKDGATHIVRMWASCCGSIHAGVGTEEGKFVDGKIIGSLFNHREEIQILSDGTLRDTWAGPNGVVSQAILPRLQ